jgi:hypothetical protein
MGIVGYLLVLIASIWISPTSAVFIEFQNCLSESYQNDTPLSLQFIPKFVDAVFNTTDPSHNLRVTVWGNVTGSGPNGPQGLPPGNDTAYWQNDNITDGKIANITNPDSSSPKVTTLFNKINVLTYQPWNHTVAFCNELTNASCPLGPVFSRNV